MKDDNDDDDNYKDYGTMNFSWIHSMEFRKACLSGKEAFKGPVLPHRIVEK